jgi:hypothetical protein
VEEPFREGEEEEMKQVPYAQLVGSLMYLMTSTRPDLAYPVSVLARYMADGHHRKKHWVAAKRVLRYLQGTKTLGIVLGGPTPIQLHVSTDSSWGDCMTSRRSTQGFVTTLGMSPISWKSQRSEAVALSTPEAEYYAVGQGGREAKFLRMLLKSVGYEQEDPTPLACDNQSTLCISKNTGMSQRTKHIDLRHHWIREAIEEGDLALHYVPTERNPADIMTKALGDVKHRKLLSQLHMCTREQFCPP